MVNITEFTEKDKIEWLEVLPPCPIKYQALLEALKEYKFRIISKEANKSYSKMRRDVCSNNVGYSIYLAEEGQPCKPSACMKKNKSKIYECCRDIWGNYFDFDSGVLIQINKNFKCPPHKDRANQGESLIMGLGDYIGGDLHVDGRGSLPIRYNPTFFNGSKHEHYVENFIGERWSVVIAHLKKTRYSIGDLYKNTLERVYDTICMEELLGLSVDFKTLLSSPEKNRLFKMVDELNNDDLQKIKNTILEVIFTKISTKKQIKIDEELQKYKKFIHYEI